MRRAALLAAAVAAAVALVASSLPAAASAFGFRPGAQGFSVVAREENGSIDHQAGSHPFALVTTLALEPGAPSPGEPGVTFSAGDLRSLRLDLPAGLIENPSAVVQCSLAEFKTPRVSPYETSLSGESCPERSQIGTVTVTSSYGGGGERTFGVFNLEPPPGAPAEIGFSAFGSPVVFIPAIRQAEGEYQISEQATDISQHVNISALKLTLWGTPWAVAHNYQRGNCLNEAEPENPWANTCSTGSRIEHPQLAYLTLPSACRRPLVFAATIESWQQPGASSRRIFSQFDEGESETLEGCGQIPFQPTAQAFVANPRASSPSGFDFDLDVGSEGLLSPKGLNPAAVRTAVVALPEGMTINPSVGAGLLGCSAAQYAAETAGSPPGAGCPNGSKIGDFTVQSPLFPETVEGSLYLATPFANPFGTLISIYLVAKAPNRGVLVKVAGKLDANPDTGSLVATFEDLPQLPYTNLKVHFREGQRSPLATPPLCGPFQTAISLTPWSAAGGRIDTASATPITSGPEGGACPSGTPGFAPTAQAGSINSQAGAYTPFYIHLTRGDTEQEITSYSTVLPPGLLGDIANIPYCSDAAIEAARHAGGFEEEEHPSCPAASEIGHTISGYGVGPALNFAPGGLYLAGPFHGSTFSIVAIDSATVGPFDLGTVVVRSAIDVDPQTAQVSIDSSGSDPIPHIIDGIPLHLRDIRVYISRNHFTVNPTSCAPFSVTSTLTGSGAGVGQPGLRSTATATAPYQAFGCGSLPFAPQLKLRLRGGTSRGQFPALRAEVVPRPGDANIGAAKVTLPASEFLEQRHIKTICTRPQFVAEKCPADSVYGSAQAFSPLLAQPLEGPVYLRSAPERKLPDLVADLHGGGLGLRIEVVGHIDSIHGGLRGTFEGIPDAPVSRFVLSLQGGKKGLLVNSEDTCAAPQHADARFIGQNDIASHTKPKLEVNCKGSKSKKKAKPKQKPKNGKGGKR
jgi:hypothetical protein